MKKIIIAVSVLTLLLSSCGESRYYKVKNGGTVGIIENYSETDSVKAMEKAVLDKYLPDMQGGTAFAVVTVIGEENGKTYTLNSYAGYKSAFGKTAKISGDAELAEWTDIQNGEYTSISGIEMTMKAKEFLPESVYQSINNEGFDWIVYNIGKADTELGQRADEYFSK